MTDILIHYLPAGIAIILVLIIRSSSKNYTRGISREAIEILNKDSENIRKHFYLILVLSLSPIFIIESGISQSNIARIALFGAGISGGVIYASRIPPWIKFLRKADAGSGFIKKEQRSRITHSIMIGAVNLIEMIKIITNNSAL